MQGRLLFALGFLLFSYTSITQAATTVSLPSLSGVVGSFITFPVTATTSAAIPGARLQVQYDSDILALESASDVTLGSRISTWSLTLNRNPPLVATNPLTTAGVRAVMFGSNSVSFSDATLLNLRFRVVGVGSTPLIFTLCDSDDPPESCTTTDGSFSTNGCTPTTESCNGVDDDCNGERDDGFDVGAMCSVGVGACQSSGVKQCTVDGGGATCSATPSEPGVEGPFGDPTCSDGEDNDCDGSLDDADEDCAPLIPGGGARETDCMVEWSLANFALKSNKKGLPLPKQECVDGDSCDADGAINEKCRFLISACVNVPDSRLTDRQGNPACAANPIAFIDVRSLSSEQTAAFIDLGGSQGGRCANRGEKKGNLCQHNNECDAEEGSGNGKCKGELVIFEESLTAYECTAPVIPVEVELKTTRQGQLKKAAASLNLAAFGDPDEAGKIAKDADRLQLICLPAVN